jgi:pimeloyl-ACP methyl ester carboxylesterase
MAHGSPGPFDTDVVLRTLEQTVGKDFSDEWASIQAPTLIVRAERGWLGLAEANRMAAALPSTRVVTLAGAGHDVHLDAPEAWRSAVEEFLSSIRLSKVRS